MRCSFTALLLMPLLLMPLTLGLAGCGSGDPARLSEDAGFRRRVLRPPETGEVRAVPPHNIHSNGVGPYELLASFQTTLDLLPNGPSVERFEAQGLFDYRLMRTDNNALVLGVGKRNLVEFISVLDPDIARTESGMGVGAGVGELVGTLGAVLPAVGGRDKRIVSFTSLPDTRFVVDKGKVVAAVVMPSARTVPKRPSLDALDGGVEQVQRPCDTSALEKREDEIREIAKVGQAASVGYACLSERLDASEAIVRMGDFLIVVGVNARPIEKVSLEKKGPPEKAEPAPKLVILGKAQVPGLSLVAAIDTGGERPELYSVVQRRSSLVHEVILARYKLSAGRLVSIWSRVAYSLRSSEATWLGAKLSSLEFLMELRGEDRGVVVTGIFTQRERGSLRNVVPMTPMHIPVLRTRKPRPPVLSQDAGSSPLLQPPGYDATPFDAGATTTREFGP